MNILYFISVFGHGNGGHFHSLNHISNSVGALNNKIRIISFGSGTSKIIQSNKFFKKHLFFNGLNILKLKENINTEILFDRPEIIHCFDENCYNIIRLFLSTKCYKIVLNKCGGPNPKYFSNVPNLILFSLENQLWFKDKFLNSDIYLIPNRVNKINFNKKLYHRIDSDFNFVRICRISKFYKKSIFDSINLIDLLIYNGNSNIKLYIIGVIEDLLLANYIMSHPLYISGKIKLVTNSNLTIEASQMLYLADAVIGTGRGLIEAASLSIPVLAINSKGNIPILIDSNTFQDGFKTNFSERNIFEDKEVNNNINKVIQIIKEKNFYDEISKYSFSFFQIHFNLKNSETKYIEVYKNAKFGNRFIFNDIILILKSLFLFYKKSF
jgi:glycosyltransferase involved in cell wall biosynthesis